MQIDLFEVVDRAVWRQLPEDVREHIVDLLARCVLEYIGRPLAEESEADDDC